MKNDDQIHAKLDKISEDIVEIKINMAGLNSTAAGQKESIDYHIKRSDTLEDHVKKIDNKFLKMEGAYKLIGILGVFATIAKLISMYFGK